jgi:hypothetical protein
MENAPRWGPAHDEALGLQRLQRSPHAGAADPKPINHFALDEARTPYEAKREDGLPQRLRAATSDEQLERAHRGVVWQAPRSHEADPKNPNQPKCLA